MVRGDSNSYTLVFDEDGVVKNITGWTIFFTLKTNWQLPDSEASLKKVITVHTNPTAGTSVLTLAPADTSSLEPGIYDYDIQAKTATGDIYTVLRGKMTLDFDVTIGTT
jgi:hypothetical protein